MELTAQLFRAMSHPPRLQILRLLTVLEEQAVTELAEAMTKPQFRISASLRVLATSGLVWRRRSGTFIYYRLAEKPRRPVTRAVLDALPAIYGAIPPDDPKAIAGDSLIGDLQHSDDALIAWFRAFTHPRRLQIIRFVHTRGSADLPLLTQALSMSSSACWRHLARLQDCGIVHIPRGNGPMIVKPAKCEDPIRQKIVHATLKTLKPQK